MTNIHKEVQTILSTDRAIQKNLRQGLLNTRALARYIQHQGVSGSIDAIISAIRRFEQNENILQSEKEIENCFSSMIIKTKSNILKIELKDNEFRTICEDYIGRNILKKNTRIIKSKETVHLFLNQKDYDEKKKLFSQINIIETKENLAELRLSFQEKSNIVIKLLARIGIELSLEGVSIEGIIEAMPEILIYVRESDLVLAHKAIMNLNQKNL